MTVKCVSLSLLNEHFGSLNLRKGIFNTQLKMFVHRIGNGIYSRRTIAYFADHQVTASCTIFDAILLDKWFGCKMYLKLELIRNDFHRVAFCIPSLQSGHQLFPEASLLPVK